MREEIQNLEKIAKQLHLSPEQRSKLAELSFHFASEFVDNLNESPVFDNNSPDFHLTPSFENPSTPEEIFDQYKQEINSSGLNAASPYHLAYIPGGGLVPSAFGDFLGTITNKYVGINFVAPAGVKIENDLIYWMAEMVGYDPALAGGSLCSGGSIANLIAVIAARDDKLNADQFSKAVVYTTNQTHHCVQKALRIAGFVGNEEGQEGNITYISVDEKFNMIPSELEKTIKRDRQDGKIPWMVVASAGTTNFGNIDPLKEIGNIAQSNDIWYHIDAAYGGYFLLTEYGKRAMDGVELSDSIVLDSHKSLFIPYGSGNIIVKDKEKLFNSFWYDADYIQDELEKYSPANVSPELTKPFRSLRIWLPLKLFGLAPFRAALNEKLLLSKYAHAELSSHKEIEIINQPQLSVFGIRFIPEPIGGNLKAINDFNQQLLDSIVREGKVFLSGTWYKDLETKETRFVIRITVLSFRTHLEHVQTALKLILEKYERLKNSIG